MNTHTHKLYTTIWYSFGVSRISVKLINVFLDQYFGIKRVQEFTFTVIFDSRTTLSKKSTRKDSKTPHSWLYNTIISSFAEANANWIVFFCFY